MKHITLAFLLMAALGFNAMSQPNYERDSIQMGASYVYDVYYSMSQGEVAIELRSNWDLAFRALTTSASILVNDGAGGMLWAYPNGDYSAWSTVDTAGHSSWDPLYNYPSEWEEGAFNAHATGYPDYGWGTYNQVTHNLIGDSIFILQTVNGPFKKVAILSKQSLAMIYTFRIANLDGTGDTTVTIDASTYTDKNFIYFDASTNAIVDREPISASWDVVFTKYYEELSPGVYYGVTGVLQNFGVNVAKYTMADTSNLVWDPAELMPERNTIGYDWKVFNMTSGYVVDDSMYFLVQNKDGDLYKLVFEAFAGSTTGKVVLRKALISMAGLGTPTASIIKVFPVPSSTEVTVVMPENMSATSIKIFDLQGRLVKEMKNTAAKTQLVDISALPVGMYILKVDDGNQSFSSRLIKN